MRRLLLVLLCLSGTCVRAQTGTGSTSNQEAFWHITSGANTAPDPGASLSDVRMKQEGTYNTALLSVIGNAPNRLDIGQSGHNNYTDATLSGLNNNILLTQTGNNNSVSLGLNGTNNRITLAQDGGDRIQMQDLQQANTRLQINQGTGNNTLTIGNPALFQNANGMGIPNLRIEQSGGAAAIIQNGRTFGN